MRRFKLDVVRVWRHKASRKPLLVKGARQVGKTWLVRALGKEFTGFVELKRASLQNERRPRISQARHLRTTTCR
jgi:predicted AAA+ superfamily ATPase